MITRGDMAKKKIPFREVVISIKQSFSYIFSVMSAKKIIIFFAIILIQASLPAAFAFLHRLIIDYAALIYETTDDEILVKAIWITVTFFTASFFFSLVNMFRSVFFEKIFRFAQDKMNEDVLRKCCNIKFKYFSDVNFYKQIAFISTRAPGQVNNLFNHTISTITDILAALGIVFLIISVNPLLIFIILIGAIPAFLLYKKQTNLQYAEAYWEFPSYRRLNYAFTRFMDRACLKEIRFGGLGNYLFNKWKKGRKEVVEERKKLNYSLVFYNFLILFFLSLSFTVSLGFVARDIFLGIASVGVFAMMLSAVQSFNGSIKSISRNIVYIVYCSKYLYDFRQLMASEEEQIAANNVTANGGFDIQLEEVTFRYPNTKEDVLQDISVRIRPGEKIAIVGENGSGKSTFVALLTGLFAPQNGRVLFNGQDLQECLGEVRRFISCIYQEYGKFEVPVNEFIRMGDLYREIDQEEIKRASGLAGAEYFINKLPDKYETDLGTLNKIGIDISGGEWQRLLIARALIRKNAKIMILDEPTAALDPKAESRLYREFEQLTGNKTTILISHRLGITNIVDRILVFDKGRIVAEGSHQELIKKNQLYRNMYQAQSQWYM